MNAEEYYEYVRLGEPDSFQEKPDNRDECCKSMNCRECESLADGFGYVCPSSIVDMYIMPRSIKLFDRSWNTAKKKYDSLDERHKLLHIDNKLYDYYKCLGATRVSQKPLCKSRSIQTKQPVQLEIPF